MPLTRLAVGLGIVVLLCRFSEEFGPSTRSSRDLFVEMLRQGLSGQVDLGGDFPYEIGYEATGLSVDELTEIVNTELSPLGYQAMLVAEGRGDELFETGESASLDVGQPGSRVAVYRCQPMS